VEELAVMVICIDYVYHDGINIYDNQQTLTELPHHVQRASISIKMTLFSLLPSKRREALPCWLILRIIPAQVFRASRLGWASSRIYWQCAF
jgi:hypothetical protein